VSLLLAHGCDWVFRVDEVLPPATPDGATTDSTGPCTFGPWSTPARISANSADHDEDPAIHPDGSLIVFTRRTTADADLYVATRNGSNGDFGGATKLPFSAQDTRETGAFWSPQGDRLYFKQADEFFVVPYADGAFGPTSPTTELDSLSYVERPRLASTELEIIYYRNTPTEIWHATRLSPQAPWTEEKLDALASAGYDEGPTLASGDLTLYFQSDRSGTTGDRHIYVASRPARDQPFGAPTDLGNFGVEAPAGPDISRDGLTMVFGGYPSAESDIFVMQRSCDAAP
jgi:Tol biopolymer transport system component